MQITFSLYSISTRYECCLRQFYHRERGGCPALFRPFFPAPGARHLSVPSPRGEGQDEGEPNHQPFSRQTHLCPAAQFQFQISNFQFSIPNLPFPIHLLETKICNCVEPVYGPFFWHVERVRPARQVWRPAKMLFGLFHFSLQPSAFLPRPAKHTFARQRTKRQPVR